MIRPLIIGEAEQAALDALKEYAGAHPLGIPQFMDIRRLAAQDDPPAHLLAEDHYVTLPHEIEVCLTYELQPHNRDRALDLRLWHFSVRLLNAAPDLAPHPVAVQAILKALHLPPMSDALQCDLMDGVVHFWFDAAPANN